MRPFTTREAATVGVSSGRLRALDLVTPTSGVRMAASASFEERCRAVLMALPSGAFICGVAAGVLHGIPLPWRLARLPQVEVGTPAPGRAIRRNGIRGRSLIVRDGDVVHLHGIRVASRGHTWCDLARILTVPELVAAGDPLLAAGVDLASAVARHRDRRWCPKLRVALDLLDPASESPKESETRAVLLLAGLPRPRVNITIYDEGRFVARVDLLYEEFGEVLEYQGDHHRVDAVQWRRDRTREAQLESTGLHVIEVTQLDLDDPEPFVRRVARVLSRKGWTGRIALSRWFPVRPS